MSIRTVTRGMMFALAIGLANLAHGQVPWWYIYAPAGAHDPTGPGAGSPGKLVISPVETTVAGALSGLWDGVVQAADMINTVAGSRGTKEDEVQKSVGERASGTTFAPLRLDVDALTLVQRQQMLDELKASRDAEAFKYFILYAEALQAHEAKQNLFVGRLNALIKVNGNALNWQERVRLAADVGLLGGQQAVAEQEMVELQNRAIVTAALNRLEEVTQEAARRRAADHVKSLLGGMPE